ncbi:hypothetical protein [Sneathiella sp.]|uniref:hypothetical protein n=1 Tax=Sneathiella sp. TaxID=1964365 RepID=UPI0035699CF3
MRRQRIVALALCALAPLLLTAAPARAEGAEFDVVGLKLGMTLAETRAILHDGGYDADPKRVAEHRLHYNYSDGVHNNLQTDDFVFYIDAGKDTGEGVKKREDSFSLYFSPPPEEQRLVSISRYYENQLTPPTSDEYHAALIEKYGPPDEDTKVRMVWYFPAGKVNCVVGGFSPGSKKDIVYSVFQPAPGGGFADQMRNPKAKSLDDCASYLVYSLNGIGQAPASNVTASMVDVQNWARSTLESYDWVDELQKKATEARLGKGSKPKL